MPNANEIGFDLDENLNFKYSTIRIEGNTLIIGEKGNKPKFVLISEIKHSEVEQGIGICRLLLYMRNGKAVEAAYFTKGKLADAIAFSEVLNKRINGDSANISFAKETKREEEKLGTLLWLYGFLNEYRATLAFGVLLSIALTLLNLLPPYVLAVLIDNVILSHSHSIALFYELIGVLVASYVCVALVTVGQNYILNKAGYLVINDLITTVYRHVTSLSSSFIDRMPSGRIISRLTSDVGNAQWLMIWGVPTLATNFLTLIGIGSILFIINAQLAVYVLIPVPFILAALVSYRKRSHRFYHKNWRRSADTTALIADTLNNHFIIKSFSKEEFENKRLGEYLKKHYNSQIEVVKMNLNYWPVLGFITAASSVIIWWIGGNEVIAGVLPLGVITAFVAYIIQFYAPINNLSNVIPFIQRGITSGDRLREVLNTELDVKNSENAIKPSLIGDIKFQNVNFGYEKFNPVIKNMNIQIRRGEKIALVGRSGCGKSTMSKLLMRFYDVESGSIKINSADVKEVDVNYLRDRIAYVPQDVTMFDDSVAYNIAYGTNRQVRLIDVIAACKAAKIHDEIRAMPFIYDTNLGERGSALSGGQKQRMSIARAIIKMPDIVIMDEATSNLDFISEQEVYGGVLNLSKGKTTIFVTHNLHEVLGSDRAIVMENGIVIESGKPMDLIKKKGALYRIFRDQIKSQNYLNWNVRGSNKFQSLEGYLKGKIIKNYKDVAIHSGSTKSRVNLKISNRIMKDLCPIPYFPVSDPHFIALCYNKGDEVLFIEDYRKLDSSSAKIIEYAINYSFFSPSVKSVKGINIRGDEIEWTVVTDKGVLSVNTPSRRNVLVLKDKVVLFGKDGNIYNIWLNRIDARSLKLVNETV